MSEPAPLALPVLVSTRAADAKPLLAMDGLGDVPLELAAPLGVVEARLRDILALNVGSVLMLDHLTGEPLPVTANGTPVAKAEVRVHGERFAVRITEILARETPRRPGGAEPHARTSTS